MGRLTVRPDAAPTTPETGPQRIRDGPRLATSSTDPRSPPSPQSRSGPISDRFAVYRIIRPTSWVTIDHAVGAVSAVTWRQFGHLPSVRSLTLDPVLRRSSHEGTDPDAARDVRRVLQGGEDVVVRQLVVLAQQLLDRLPRAEQLQDHLYRDARAPNAGLAVHDIGIDRDAIQTTDRVTHAFSVACRPTSSEPLVGGASRRPDGQRRWGCASAVTRRQRRHLAHGATSAKWRFAITVAS